MTKEAKSGQLDIETQFVTDPELWIQMEADICGTETWNEEALTFLYPATL